jgi:hypothetical protein
MILGITAVVRLVPKAFKAKTIGTIIKVARDGPLVKFRTKSGRSKSSLPRRYHGLPTDLYTFHPIPGNISRFWDVEVSILVGSKWLSAYLVAQARDLAKNKILFVTNLCILLFTVFPFRDGRRLYARPNDAIPWSES